MSKLARMIQRRHRPIGANAIGLAILCIAPLTQAFEITPLHRTDTGAAVYSERTVTLSVEVDRDGARLLAYTLKGRPFVRASSAAEPKTLKEGEAVQLEIALIGPSDQRFTQRVEVPGLCLTHPALTEPHVEGDTIRMHRESIVVELPERADLDLVEVAYYVEGPGGLVRNLIGRLTLDAAHFTRAGAKLEYTDLAFAAESVATYAEATTLQTSGEVHWPEEYGDPDIYRVWGNEAEAGRRVNIVLVPDGYTYASKATMEAHAQQMVDYFRATTPYAQHDLFVNYILVYAYSNENGTDECDCNIEVDTAMASRFYGSYPCRDMRNRCLSYGYGCDTDTSHHIGLAELRAPAQNKTIVMVNTTRYGGCGGYRATYAAANSEAIKVAIHEFGHSFPGLADEYVSYDDCGTYAGESNTSMNATEGAWPEWIAELGPPREGAQYYTHCIYRPMVTCKMQALASAFCPVCNQHTALDFFAHPNVQPTAPIASAQPDPAVPIAASIGVPVSIAIGTRFPTGSGVDSSIDWSVDGPYPYFLTHPTPERASVTFRCQGDYTVGVEAIGDIGMIKPVRYGPNVDDVNWNVDVAGCCLSTPFRPQIVSASEPAAAKVIVKCPRNERVVAGGCSSNGGAAMLRSEAPYYDAGWSCDYSANPGRLTATALCVDRPMDACWGISTVQRTLIGSQVTATCPIGKRVIGGGCSSAQPSVSLATSRPDLLNGWACSYNSLIVGSVTAFAICSEADLDIGLETVSGTDLVNRTMVVKCPATKRLVGGGCRDNQSRTLLYSTEPYGDVGWSCTFRENPGGITTYAICDNP